MQLKSITAQEESEVLRRKVNENNNLVERSVNSLESDIKLLQSEIASLKTTITGLRNENSKLKNELKSSTEKSFNAKYIKLGSATGLTMKPVSVFVEDGVIKFKDENGVISIFDLTAE